MIRNIEEIRIQRELIGVQQSIRALSPGVELVVCKLEGEGFGVRALVADNVALQTLQQGLELAQAGNSPLKQFLNKTPIRPEVYVSSERTMLRAG